MISVLYADLVGFTARSHDADPEEVRELQRGFQRCVRAEVEHGGGGVEKFIGDAVVASFPEPEEAVHAACRTIRAIPGLAIRVGVSTGVEDESGELVEIASRIQHLAGPNAVAVDEPTARATEHDFDYEQLDAIVLPGRPRPTPVFRTTPSQTTETTEAGDDVEGSAKERRQVVSVLFADLFNLAAPSHSADPRDIRSTQNPYYRGLQGEIERFGGTVEKFVGDALMAVFGTPVASEDDAERAVRAAVRIPEVVQELNEQDDFLELGVRVAVNSGEVVVAIGAHPEQGEAMVTGDIVNTAARLLGVAPFNGVAVGRPTYEATKSAFDYRELASVTVKGIPEPVAVYSPG
jgi:class 3 adenylate cyclase